MSSGAIRKATNMFGSGAKSAHGGAEGIDNNQQSVFKVVYQQINKFRSRTPSNQDLSPGAD